MNPRVALPLVFVLALALAGAFTWFQFRRWRRDELPVLQAVERGQNETTILKSPRPLPSFTLDEAQGGRLGLADLRGKVWLADFIFTTCPDSCPGMSARFQAIQKRVLGNPELEPFVKLISFSVDPELDTRETLRAYGEKLGAEPKLWKLLSGKPGEVAELSQKGFYLSAVPGSAPGEPRFLHSDRFALVDAKGQLRALIPARADVRQIDELVDYLRSTVIEGFSLGVIARPEAATGAAGTPTGTAGTPNGKP